MEQLRVVDLAHTMGITSRVLIFKLRSIGVTVASEEDTLDLATVRAIITGETLQRRPREVISRREKAEEETAIVSAKDRLARRRKRQVVETDKEIKEVVTEAKPVEPEIAAEDEAPSVDAVEEVAEVEAVAEVADVADAVDVAEEILEEDIEIKPEVEITEEEITAERKASEEGEAPKRVRPTRAKTPLEQSLRELTEEEIRQRLSDQKAAAKKAKTQKVADRGTGRKAKAAADHLLNLINDILDISKIEAGRLDLEQIDFALKDVLDNIVNLTGQKAAEKGLPLQIDLPSNVAGLSLRGDSMRLTQILLNLTGNAIKFSQQGTIEVRAEAIEETATEVLLRFEVRDSGIGISADEQTRLFVTFEQADGSVNRQYKGTGLGLSLTKKIVELHGGKIWAESDGEGKGSRFSFTIPLMAN